MSPPLSLTVDCGLYDRTLPLAQGIIRPSGLSLEWSSLPPHELFDLVLEENIPSADKRLKYANAGSNRFVCLPIFLSRMFRHSALFVRKDSALMPEQLRGKRIGVSNYAMIAATHTALIVDRMKILYYHRKMRS